MTGRSPAAEQTFFADPALDRILGVVMALAAEVFVLRRELQRLSGAADVGPGDADAFVHHLLSPILGETAKDSDA